MDKDNKYIDYTEFKKEYLAWESSIKAEKIQSEIDENNMITEQFFKKILNLVHQKLLLAKRKFNVLPVKPRSMWNLTKLHIDFLDN